MSFCISEKRPGLDSRPASIARRFVRRSIKPVIVRLSRRLSVTYWPRRGASLSAVLLSLLAGFVPQLASAAPTGAQVVAGIASVTRPTVSSTQIQQTSQNAIINWQSFSIAAGESVRFVQPNVNAIALNRVIGADPSRIFGTLSANGQVFLVNQAGVYFAPGASVDVGGLVATSMNISDADFLKRKFVFSAGDHAGAVSNYGHLRGAYVTLAAPQVTNGGDINTAGGATALAAGARLALDLSGDRLVSMSVDAAAANAAVVNSGSISADGGAVFMTARSANAVLDTVINTTGMVRASSIVSRGGKIVIDGGSAGTVAVDGTLAASGGTQGGTVEVLGDRVALQAGTRINVSGDAGGGRALVGGDFHGAGAVRTASFTQVDQGAVINADARTAGKGGDVAVWADQHTAFAGSISAAGGAQGGDGGFVETSGKQTLAFSGAVNTTAAKGATGTLLLDPTDMTISTAASGAVSIAGGTFLGSASSSNINVGDLTTALGSSNVIVDTSSNFASLGNITVNTSVQWGSGNSLTLKADTNIAVNALIRNTSSGGINLNGGGAVSSGSLITNSGAINIAGNAGGSSRAGSVTGTSMTSTSGSVNVRSQGNVTTGIINAGTGTISIDSNAGVAITGALTTSNTGSAAIVVNAGANSMAGSGSGGDISVSGGSVTAGVGGRATLYTGSVAGSTGVTSAVGAGSGRFRYGSDSSTANYSAGLGAGTYTVYRESPTLSFTATAPSITYGDAAPAVSATLNGLQNGDTSAQAISSGTASASIGGAFSNGGKLVAGTHPINVSGNAADQLGYSIQYTPGQLVVAQKALSVSGLAAPASKTYDATVAATVSGTAALGGRVAGDGVSLTGSATGAYNSKDVATANAVSFGGLSLNGADAANYTLAMQAPAAATITPKSVAVSGLSVAPSKVYDATANAPLTGAAAISTEAAGIGSTSDGKAYTVDNVNLAGAATATYNSKNVAGASTVTFGGLSLQGTGAANYTLAMQAPAAATITAKTVAVGALSVAASKVYDGTDAATVVGAPQLAKEAPGAGAASDGKAFDGDAVSPSGTATAAYNSKNVASASTVTFAGISLTGTDSGNYLMASLPTASATITPKSVSASGLSVAASKIYDGTTKATLIGAAALSSEAAGAGTTADGKVYAGDNINLAGAATGAYNSKNVASASSVIVGGLTLTGADLANYTLTVAPLNAVITPKLLSMSGLSVPADKTDDGTTTAHVSGTAVLAAAEAVGTGSVTDGKSYIGDTVAISGTPTGTYNSADVYLANTVTVAGLSLTGDSASNYGLNTVMRLPPKLRLPR